MKSKITLIISSASIIFFFSFFVFSSCSPYFNDLRGDKVILYVCFMLSGILTSVLVFAKSYAACTGSKNVMAITIGFLVSCRLLTLVISHSLPNICSMH